MKCRHCLAKLNKKFIDLGYAPPSNNYLEKKQLSELEIYLPLRVLVCHKCWLVQTENYTSPSDLFKKNYAYLSSTSKTWVKHASDYTNVIINKLSLSSKSFVVEIASNDGYLLKNFVNKKIPCLGIEPTELSAEIAKSKGVKVIKRFFDSTVAKEVIENYQKADLICGNNVYAHVPDINDFTKGLKLLLAKNGTITLEYPHLLNLIIKKQFDTIYHEHYSYLSLTITQKIFKKFGLKIYDVEQLNTHGGSLRTYACHDDDSRKINLSVTHLLRIEKNYGLEEMRAYLNLQKNAYKIKSQFIKFLVNEKSKGKVICGYGAAAKANTLINYAGVKNDFIDFICDASKQKQNKFMPGSHIPIVSPNLLKKIKPDWVIIFPWNISGEIIQKVNYIQKWGGKFISFENGKIIQRKK